MKKVYILIISFSIVSSLFSQGVAVSPPSLSWSTTIGSSRSDQAIEIQQTLDGGYIMVGITESYGAGLDDVYLVKTDSKGTLAWSTTFGGSTTDYGQSIATTRDGGYIITGGTCSYGMGSFDLYLIKTDNHGTLEWSTTFGGSGFDYGHYVLQAQDGGYIVAGYTQSFGAGSDDVYLIKTNQLGTLEWSTTIGGAKSDRGFSIAQCLDGGYIITGETNSNNSGYVLDVYLVKTDSLGNFQWQKYFGGSGYDRGYSVKQTQDGGFIITGETNSFGSDYDVYLIKTDPVGTLEWSTTLGGTGNQFSYCVQQAKDNGYIISGWSMSSSSAPSDVYIVKTDYLGTFEWSTTFGGSGDEYGMSVQQTKDGGYIVAGMTNSYGAGSDDIYLIKLDGRPTSAELWSDMKTNYVKRYYLTQ
ncbi:MAG: hypothetical protein ACE14V_04625 [bacterium]